MVLATGTILGLTALAKSGKSIYDYYQNKDNAPSPYAQTEQGKRLAEQQKTGAYSGQIRNEMIGGVNRVASASAETNRANYIGRMSNQGLGTSVAAQRGLNEIEAGRGRIVANEAGRVGALNAQSKITAGDQLAAGTDQRADQILQYNQQNRQQLTGGLTDAATGYLSGSLKQNEDAARRAQEITLDRTEDEREMIRRREARNNAPKGIVAGGIDQGQSAPLSQPNDLSGASASAYIAQQTQQPASQEEAKNALYDVFGGVDGFNTWHGSLQGQKPENWLDAYTLYQQMNGG